MTVEITNFPFATPVKAQGLSSFEVSIGTDEVYVSDLPGISGFLFISTSSITNYGGQAWIRGSYCIKMAGAATFATLAGSVLTGTTGEVGNFSISCNAGKLYIENRIETAQSFVVTLLTNDATNT